MSSKHHILFDLDGTLTDSFKGIVHSVQYALSRYGIVENDLHKLTPFIGPPLTYSFREFYHFSDAQASIFMWQPPSPRNSPYGYWNILDYPFFSIILEELLSIVHGKVRSK